MEKKLTKIDGEEFSQFLSRFACSSAVSDEYFRNFGFKERPKRGQVFRRFVNPISLQKEDFLLRELFTSSISTALLCLPKEYSLKYKIKVAARVLEIVFSHGRGMLEGFQFNSIDEALTYICQNISDYLKRNDDKDNLSAVFKEHAMNFLGSNYTPDFLLWSLWCEQQFLTGYFDIKVFIKNEIPHPILDNIVLSDENIIDRFYSTIKDK